MRISKSWVAAQVLATLAASTTLPIEAAAQDRSLVMASDLSSILGIAKAHGQATLTQDKEGDPLIKGRINGLAYSIYFYDCKDHANCASLQFSTGFVTSKKPGLERINDWHAKMRWTKAFADKDGNAITQMDVGLMYGMSRPALDDVFVKWSVSMRDFARFVGYLRA